MFTPYIGAGAGLAIVDGDTTFDDAPYGYGNGGVGFAFQLGAGLTVDVTENIALDLGYRFKGILDVGFEDSDGEGMYSGGNLYSHNVQAGVTFGFPALGATTEPVDTFSGDSSFYVSLFGGASVPHDLETNYFDEGTDYSVDLKTGYIVGGAIGARIWDPVRAELEVSYSRWKADDYSSEEGDDGSVDGDVEATYILGNLWYDFRTESVFTPYAGGGIGIAFVDADTTFDGESFGYGDGETGFAFQLGAGVQFGLTEHIALDLGYRFKGVLDVEFQDSDDEGVYAQGDLFTHNLQAGVIFGF
jgi:opacity protein-like surface antigen